MTDDEIVAPLAESIQVVLASRGIHRPIEEIVADLLDESEPLLSDAEVSAKWEEFKRLVKLP